MDHIKNLHNKRRITCPLIWAIISLILLVVSLCADYQFELIKEHMRFRKGFPTRSVWENPPDGNLNCYFFNVTNTVAFLNGTDKKLHLEQVGPIVYRIKAVHRNLIDNEDDSTLTFRKIRYQNITFDEENNIPGILNEKIYLPNVILLSLVAKMHNWFFLAKNALNLYASSEPIFLHRTIDDFLWNYSTPLIDHLSQYVPGVLQNAGTLHNAFREKEEIFTVNIGTKNGIENFFKIRNLNNHTVIAENFKRGTTDPKSCPVHAINSFDNTLFPPYLTREDRLSIVAGDSCRVLPLVYDSDVNQLGFSGYKFVVPNEPNNSCLRNSMGIPLPEGLFDVSMCSFDVPSAYSQPHFFDSSYNYEQHFEGLSPNAEEHQTFLLIEPTTGIPFEEKYRFMSNIPLPILTGFSDRIQRFSGMKVPTFWYEYDLDELPTITKILLKLTAYYSPYIQKVCVVLFFLAAVASSFTVACRIYDLSPRETFLFSRREMKQTITEKPNNEIYYKDSSLFLPKQASKA